MSGGVSEVLLDADAVGRAIRRIASEIVEATRGAESVALVGVRRGGVGLSERLAAAIREAEGREVPVGTVDIALYRDDAATALPDPKIGPSVVPFDPHGRDVVLVDDVLQTGRTIRAAIDCLMDFGRPRRVWLAVLLDRGGRELPIAADFVGKTVEVPAGAKVAVEIGGAPSDEDAAIIE
ncbi:MAG: bifunctional pyr operon transcriptional regulator/uracil phosphoribosyltransferase [Sandaracinus sp.]|nr:bifunctional pyr operon transcriptional regulator/uracil phosphoribosyltransferase [Myxococcales bacterium]MAT25199.1 bifunctional pyr operon transcriptional regulator/uracil phosphoribosyltransferase [Sandaracinus sp.]MBJ75121.1 bifunctional pyr operon transcriptional regulator/uracil phosphoribosyltransferase [Sandaracinus sp.]